MTRPFRDKYLKGLRALGLVAVLTLTFGGRAGLAGEALVPLVQPGPWSAVDAIIGYGPRLWFVNSEVFKNHNAADVYSYDPAEGSFRYERALFSQGAGRPLVASRLLYWPFEDARFSAGRAEFSVTNGEDWAWRVLPEGRAFHLHAMAQLDSKLYAATSAWRAGLQVSEDGGTTWQVIYDHPTPEGRVSRITSLAVFKGALYAGLTQRRSKGPRLLRLTEDGMAPVPGWPESRAAGELTVYQGRLYAILQDENGRSLWRSDGSAVEEVTGLHADDLRALAPGDHALWAVSGSAGRGALWRAAEGVTWEAVQKFETAVPVALTVYEGNPYLGSIGPEGRGTLWGPPPPAARRPPLLTSPRRALPGRPTGPAGLARAQLAALEQLGTTQAAEDAVPRDDAWVAQHLLAPLRALAESGDPAVGPALARRLTLPLPEQPLAIFGGKLQPSTAQLTRWYLLWALAQQGGGRVPVALLQEDWDEAANRPEKYFHPIPAAAWVAAALGQKDPDTIAALIARLGRPGDPPWLDGDLTGALTALTGQRLGHDRTAWRAWWTEQNAEVPAPPDLGLDLLPVPAGDFTMGDAEGDANEAPRPASVKAFRLMRHEVTNRQFDAFVAKSNHRTDAELSGKGFVWDGSWRRIKGADWRHPRGPQSTIKGKADHPVVQVSARDAAEFCAFHGLRLPQEVEWEFAARGSDGRRFPWGDGLPEDAGRRHANFGTLACCAPDDSDGFAGTAPVGRYPSGSAPFGQLDMAGNVWEWTSSPFPGHPEQVALRGGGWGNNPYCLRAAYRHGNPPDIGLDMVGFRCAGDL